MWLAGAWLFLNCPDAVSPLFKKRKRARKKKPTSKSQRKISCRLLCFANTGLFSRPLPPLPARLEMKMAPLFLSLGPNCSESAAPETLRCTGGEGGRDRAVAVCGRSYINTACVDNAAGRMGAEAQKDFAVLAMKLLRRSSCGSKRAAKPAGGRGRGGGCEWPCRPGSD